MCGKSDKAMAGEKGRRGNRARRQTQREADGKGEGGREGGGESRGGEGRGALGGAPRRDPQDRGERDKRCDR